MKLHYTALTACILALIPLNITHAGEATKQAIEKAIAKNSPLKQQIQRSKGLFISHSKTENPVMVKMEMLSINNTILIQQGL